MYWKPRANFFRLEQGYVEHNFSNRAALQQASFYWMLTDKEKCSILSNIHTQGNQAALTRARQLFQP